MAQGKCQRVWKWPQWRLECNTKTFVLFMMKGRGTEASGYHSASLQNPNRCPGVFMGVCVTAVHRLSLNLVPVVTCCWSMNGYVWHMALAGDSWQWEWEEGECLPESYGACLSSPDNVLLGAHWTVASLKVSCWDSWDHTTVCPHR